MGSTPAAWGTSPVGSPPTKTLGPPLRYGGLGAGPISGLGVGQNETSIFRAGGRSERRMQQKGVELRGCP